MPWPAKMSSRKGLGFKDAFKEKCWHGPEEMPEIWATSRTSWSTTVCSRPLRPLIRRSAAVPLRMTAADGGHEKCEGSHGRCMVGRNPKFTIPKWSEHNPVNLITGICKCTGDWGKEASPVCRSCSVEKGAHVAIQGCSETFLPGEVGRIVTCEPNHFGVIPAILSTCSCGMLKRMNIASLQGWCSCQPLMKPCFHGVDEHVVGRFGTTLLECCEATPRRSCFVRSSSASRQMRQPLSQTLIAGQNQFQELAQRPLPELW